MATSRRSASATKRPAPAYPSTNPANRPASWEIGLSRIAADFQDPHQEWRRLFAEFLGTFLLVLVAAGGGMMSAAFPDSISRTAAVTAPALMVLGIILSMGKVSGAHLNPAVSIAFALRGDFPWRRVPATSSCSWPGSRSPRCSRRR